MIQHQNPFSRQSFSNGPKVAIHFLDGKNGQFKIHITESKDFASFFFFNFDPSFQEKILQWLFAYSRKEETPVLQFARQILPPFSEKVLRCLENIPFGKTLSYGEIALQAGNQRACRAVGTICRSNAWPLFIPCHRVLPKNGTIGQYAFGPSIKRALLEFEDSF